jgi:hypothetical protein
MVGQRHEVPQNAVRAFRRILARERMVGLEMARSSALSHRLGLATTLVAAVTSLGIFTTLAADSGTSARVIVGVVTGVAAVLSAWQTYAAKSADAAREALAELLQEVIPVRQRLDRAVSECQLNGTPIDQAVLEEAEAILTSHELARPGEYPSFERAEAKALQELTDRGLYAGRAA